MTIITLLFYLVVVFCLPSIVYQLAELLEIQRREEYNHAQNFNEIQRNYGAASESVSN
jgi:predicted PurR-regulated permease PerM